MGMFARRWRLVQVPGHLQVSAYSKQARLRVVAIAADAHGNATSGLPNVHFVTPEPHTTPQTPN
eukprot:4935446-Amphidinium_carterae.2